MCVKQRFSWTGVTTRGEPARGHVTAQHRTEAHHQLRQQGIIAHAITRQRLPRWRLRPQSITPRDISLFSHQLATTIATGLPLVQVLALIAKSQTNHRMQQLIARLHHDVEAGLTYAEALRQHPHAFNALCCNLVAVGEASGTLDVVLAHMATHLETTERIKHHIKKALTYPAAVILMATLVTAGLLIGVVPQFESLFRQFGADLPFATRCVIHVSQSMQTHWLSLMIGMTLPIVLVRHAYRHWPRFITIMDKIIIRSPLVGEIIQKIIIARIASALAMTYTAGLPFIESLPFIAPITGNTHYTQGILQIRAAVSQGERLQSAMRDTGLFPEFVMHMVHLGEESGTVDHMLRHVARYYDDTIDRTIQTVSRALEPLIMALLGSLIGGLVIAMYLPMLNLGSIV